MEYNREINRIQKYISRVNHDGNATKDEKMYAMSILLSMFNETEAEAEKFLNEMANAYEKMNF